MNKRKWVENDIGGNYKKLNDKKNFDKKSKLDKIIAS